MVPKTPVRVDNKSAFYAILNVNAVRKQLLYLLSERKDRGEGHFEVLEAEGDAHDGDAEKEAEGKVEEGYLPPAEEDPDEVHHGRYTAGLVGAIDKFMAERPEGIGSQHEELDAEGYADDGDAHQKAHDEVDEGDNDSTQNQPEDITEKFHMMQIYSRKGSNANIIVVAYAAEKA